MKETWKPVVCYEDIYEVSDRGRVKSLDRMLTEKNGKRRKKSGRILTPIALGNYYGFQLCKNGTQTKFYTHRLVASHFIENNNKEANSVNHINGDKNDNNAENLEWLTQAENNRHAIATGLKKVHGEDNPVCKFSDRTVREVRDLFDNEVFIQSEIADMYGISRMQIHRIVKRKLRNGRVEV